MILRRVIFLLGLCAMVLSAGVAEQAHAQADFVESGSDAGLTLEGYMAKAGPGAKLIAAGKLKIDKHRMACGRRPTVIDPKFDSWGGAYPGYLILMAITLLSSMPSPCVSGWSSPMPLAPAAAQRSTSRTASSPQAGLTEQSPTRRRG